jgi:D-sedoheptulose 7-phosphate isomerase
MTLHQKIDEARETFQGLAGMASKIEEVAGVITQALLNGNSILVCGNGGSAAEGQHFVTELVGRYRGNRRSLSAIFLGGDAGQMSCIANDFEWDEVFARPLRAYAQPGDVLLGFSTSGSSTNIVRALEAARDLDLPRIALLGKGGGAAASLATHALIVDSDSTARIQEAHLFILHWICEQIELAFPQ